MADGLPQILARAAAIDKLSHYELLGVRADADGRTISDAYYQLLRTYHPDRFASLGDPAKRRLLALFCARIGEARRVLLHPRARADYDQSLATGEPVPTAGSSQTVRRLADSRDPKHPQARSMFERASMMAKSGDLRGAKAQLQLAKQFEPSSKAIAALIEQLDAPQAKPGGSP